MPLPSWRTGRMRRLLTAVSRQLVLPVAALCLSRHRESDSMPAGPVAVRHGERSARGVCFFLPRSCRGAHFIGPWLVVDVRFDVWFGTRGNRAGSKGSSVFWEVFRGRSSADWCFVVRQWSGGASRPDLADLPARYRCEGEGVAHRRCPSIPEKSRALMVRDGRFVSLETRLGSG